MALRTFLEVLICPHVSMLFLKLSSRFLMPPKGILTRFFSLTFLCNTPSSCQSGLPFLVFSVWRAEPVFRLTSSSVGFHTAAAHLVIFSIDSCPYLPPFDQSFFMFGFVHGWCISHLKEEINTQQQRSGMRNQFLCRASSCASVLIQTACTEAGSSDHAGRTQKHLCAPSK